MESNNLVLENLIKQGFNESSAKVYLVLLEMRSASLAELQKSAGIRQNKIGEVVDNLVRQGLCSEKRVGRRRFFEIIEPSTALSGIRKNLEDKISDLDNLITTLKDFYVKSYASHEPVEYIEILYGKENIHRHYLQMIRKCKEEILGFARPPFAATTRDKIEEQVKENIAFHERKGITRWVYYFNCPEQDLIIPGLLEGQKIGAKFRVAESLPMKMVIFDRQEVIITQRAPASLPDEMTNALIKNGAIASAFCALFEYFWEKSVELDEWMKDNY